MSELDLEGRVRAVEGRGGRLFVAGAAGLDVRELYGEPWTDRARLVELWSAPVARLAELAREIGAKLLVVVPPDAHAVHAEDLPEDWAYVRPSVLDTFTETFGAQVEILRLHDVLRASEGPTAMWRPTDSHWSAHGAYVAYRAMMERLAGTGARVLEPEDFSLGWTEEAGDLGALLEPPRRAETPKTLVAEPRARTIRDASNHRRHAIRVFEQDDPALPTALVFRDSFATELAPFLAESFRRTVMVGSQARAFPDLIREERPDVIIYERAERALPCGVIDWDLLTWREHWPEPGDGPNEVMAARAERAAARALDAGNLAEAEARADEAVRLGATPDRLLLLGRARLAGGRAEPAAASFGEALEADPGRWSVLMHLGIARLALGRAGEARDLFGRACAVAPWHPRGFEHFGYASLQLGDAAAARPALEQAVVLGPELAGSWLWLFEALKRLGDTAGLARARARAAAAPVDIPEPQA